MFSIIAVTADFSFALSEEGLALPITKLFDFDGDETTATDEAEIAQAVLPDGFVVVFDCEGIDRVAVN